jgi:hypothetical protein
MAEEEVFGMLEKSSESKWKLNILWQCNFYCTRMWLEHKEEVWFTGTAKMNRE